MTDAPQTSFAELAVTLRLIALNEAMGVEALEVMAARSPDQPVFATALDAARRSAEQAGAAHALIKALIPHEKTVRRLLAGNLEAREFDLVLDLAHVLYGQERGA